MSELNSCTGLRLGTMLALGLLPSLVLASTGDGLARPSSGYYADIRVHFAFDDMAQVRLHDGRDFRSGMKYDYADVEALLQTMGARNLDRLFFEHDPQVLEGLKKTGEARRGITLPDLNNWYTCVMPDEASARELVAALASHPLIRSAAVTPIPVPHAVDIAPTTPNYQGSQDYHDAANYGVGIASAWGQTNGTGTGISILHHEGGWITTHEDLNLNYTGGGNSTDSGWYNHGTACVSILAAPSNAYGVTGLAYGADELLSRGFWDNGSPNTWIACQSYLQPGDVISASWGYGGSLPSGYNCSCNPGQAGSQPAESDQADFDAIQTVTANGYIVVNSAANGCVPMDNALYNNKYNLNVRDSGALIIGAIDPGGAPACFTNYGSRIDAHAWGSSVVSAGYGDLFNGGGDNRQYYTSDFGGTSAACPIVSGSVAALQAVYKQRNAGAVMDAWQLRNLLRTTGTPQTSQQSTKPISNMPDLAELLVAIGGGGPDVVPPAISHSPLGNTGNTGPFTVTAAITDASSVTSATLRHRVNGGGWNLQAMSAAGGSNWQASIPAQVPGSVIDYYITATDGATTPNTATSSTWSFTVLTTSNGIVLLTPSASAKSGGAEWSSALSAAGYPGTIQNVDNLDGIVLGEGVDAVVVLLGIYSDNFVIPSGSQMASDLAAFITAGGNVYMEGGDCWAYDPGNSGGHDFNSLFGITGLSDGSADLTSATGYGPMAGTYAYTGANNWIDRLGASGAGLLFGSSAGYNCGYYQLGARNTACSSFEMAGLAGFNGLVQTLFGSSMFNVLAPPQDTTPPTVSLACLGATTPTQNPSVTATAADASGIASVTLGWQLNGGPAQYAAMSPAGGGTYTGTLAGAVYGSSVTYTATAVDASSNGNVAVSNSCGTQILEPAHLVVNPLSASGAAMPGASDSELLTLQNTGDVGLTWTATVTQDPFPFNTRSSQVQAPARLGKDEPDTRPGQAPNAAGGPDAFGYSWIDSDEPGGPAVTFQDISSSGTALGLGDDEVSSALALGFPFSYYGSTYNDVYVCSNGFVSLLATTNAWTNQALPDGADPAGVIAPFWDDLNPASGGTVHTQAFADRFIVQWTAVRHYGNSDVYTFQVILHDDGAIDFQYGTLVGSLTSCTIGIESPDNSIASQVVFNAAYLQNNMAVRFASAPPETQWLGVSGTGGTIAGNSSSSLTVTMDASLLAAPYTYTGVVTLTSSEPSTIQVPVSFFVGSSDNTDPSVLVPCIGDVYTTAAMAVVAEVADASGIQSVSLLWSTGGPSGSVVMSPLAGDFWMGMLPGQPVGTTSTYTVQAVDASGNGNTGSSGPCSTTVLALAEPAVTITIVSPSHVLLTWSAVPGAMQYNVYIANGLDGSYTLLQTTSGTNLTVAVSPDQARLLRVTAVGI